MGEITTHGYVDINKLVRKTIVDIGYDSSEKGFDGHTCGVITSIAEQSADIAAASITPTPAPSAPATRA
ncbi:MAG: hypothetical protein KatS3mg064_1792 [Tepidiforma sp.]|nr:MAG: hypothetical protein KatS3mg064_1792 [Tepidiforma sp.]